MKILVVSLLRMGDLVMTASAIAHLRSQYPGSTVDILTNDSNRGVLPLLAVDKAHIFSRSSLQKNLGQEDSPIFSAIDELKDLIEEINTFEYDLLVNLTQNRLSGYLCALVDAKEKNGLVITENDQACFGSPWFRHLNDFAHVSAARTFHYIDIFNGAVGLRSKADISLRLTEKGAAEIKDFNFSSPVLVIQPLTSDEKKNWSNPHWAEFIVTFARLQPDFQIHVLGAPSEKPVVDDIVALAKTQGAVASSTTLSLEGAFAFLQKADMCVSVDTGIKHLAAAAGTKKIVELVFGSSDYKRTAAYKDNSLIIRSKEDCQPCVHSAPCHRGQRFCASRVSALSVASLAAQYFRGDAPSLAAAAEEYSDEVDCFVGRISAGGFWWPKKLGHGAAEQNSAYLSELFAWRMVLQKEHLERVVPYGAHVRNFAKSMDISEMPIAVADHLMQEYAEQSRHIISVQTQIVRLIRENLMRPGNHMAIETELSELEKHLHMPNLLLLRWHESSGQGLTQVRHMQRLLSEIEQVQQIRLKMLQTLRELPQEFL